MTRGSLAKSARHRHALLFAAGKMAARALEFVAQPDRVEQLRRRALHLVFREAAKPSHRNHDVFLCGEILHEKMKLKDKSEQLVALPRQNVIGQMRNDFGFDRDFAAIGMIEQTENVKQRTFAAAGWPDDRVDGARSR